MAALAEWQKSGTEVSCSMGTPPPLSPDAPTYVTAALPLPNPLPLATDPNSMETFVPMRWQLSTILPTNSDLNGSILEVQIQQYSLANATGPASYRIREPRIATSTNVLHVQGLKFIVNGQFAAQANEYESMDTTVSPQPTPWAQTLPFPILSSLQAILIGNDPASDMISIGFDRIEKTSIVACKNLPLFQSSIMPILGQCMGCHFPTFSAGKRFSIIVDTSFPEYNLADQCVRVLQRSDLKNPAASAVITNPAQGTNGHQQFPFAPQSQAIIDWLKTEQ